MSQAGNRVSHANNRTKRRFYPNLQVKRFYLPEEGMWISIKVSAAVLRTINKKGISAVLRDAKKKGTLSKELAWLIDRGQYHAHPAPQNS